MKLYHVMTWQFGIDDVEGRSEVFAQKQDSSTILSSGFGELDFRNAFFCDLVNYSYMAASGGQMTWIILHTLPQTNLYDYQARI